MSIYFHFFDFVEAGAWEAIFPTLQRNNASQGEGMGSLDNLRW